MVSSALLVLFSCLAHASPDPVSQVAQYYFSQHDYRQAYQLLKENYNLQQAELSPTLRMAELRLLFEGRASARDTLQGYLQTRQEGYDSSIHRQVREKWEALATAFLSDEGLASYYQALAKIRAGECQGALALLQSAETAEQGNFLLLKEKSQCERKLKLWDKSHESLQMAFEMFPFDSEVRDWLFESHLYFAQAKQLVLHTKLFPFSALSPRQRLAFGIALIETGTLHDGITVLESLEARDRRNAHPMLYFGIGKALALRPERSPAAINYLERFVTAQGTANRCEAEGWDPYRCKDRLEEAKRLLAKLRSRGVSPAAKADKSV